MNKPFFKLLVLIGLFLLVACASPTTQTPEKTSDITAEPPLAPQETEPPTTPPKKELPKTSVIGVLGDDPENIYKVAMADWEGQTFDISEFPFPPGSVEAHWYTSSGMYVVAYVGLDLTATGPLCPGNSILTAQGFENVTNAAIGEGACAGLGTLTSDPNVGPKICQGIMLYVTAIPSSKQGILLGTIEKVTDGGSILIGLTSQAETSPDIPEIDIEDFCP